MVVARRPIFRRTARVERTSTRAARVRDRDSTLASPKVSLHARPYLVAIRSRAPRPRAPDVDAARARARVRRPAARDRRIAGVAEPCSAIFIARGARRWGTLSPERALFRRNRAIEPRARVASSESTRPRAITRHVLCELLAVS